MDGSNSFWLQSAILPACFISEDGGIMKYHEVFLSEVFEINGWMRAKPFVTLIICDLFVTIKPLSCFLCNISLWHTNSIFFFFFLSPLICDCLLCVPFAEELEEEKESPTETELTEKQKHQLRHRELFLSRQYESLPATHIRYRTKTHTHTNIIKCRQCPWTVTYPAMKRQMPTSWVLHGACFFPLSLLGGNAVSHYWTRPKQFFHTLTKRWVREESNLGMSSFTGVCLQQTVSLQVKSGSFKWQMTKTEGKIAFIADQSAGYFFHLSFGQHKNENVQYVGCRKVLLKSTCQNVSGLKSHEVVLNLNLLPLTFILLDLSIF